MMLYQAYIVVLVCFAAIGVLIAVKRKFERKWKRDFEIRKRRAKIVIPFYISDKQRSKYVDVKIKIQDE